MHCVHWILPQISSESSASSAKFSCCALSHSHLLPLVSIKLPLWFLLFSWISHLLLSCSVAADFSHSSYPLSPRPPGIDASFSAITEPASPPHKRNPCPYCCCALLIFCPRTPPTSMHAFVCWRYFFLSEGFLYVENLWSTTTSLAHCLLLLQE
jgi:hypothetical protein